ncbi:dephospho-CoA kinase [Methylophaga sp.]|uniref:dephospho-CoA kinase n=1 Tax=Methylophaga sp. TaxID=2024840 RepID=UPI0014009CC4|nr:dephospho-CoA kinase [Methylophaga sp.]MTI63667.1 dephospho-CoA kinase [Methylophaga sp.]
MTFKVGLTGGVASGKSTVTAMFQKLGATVIDADVIARNLLAKHTPCYQRVIAAFGDEVLQQNGEINRAWLRKRIFSDVAARQTLESITHPEVRREMLAAAADCQSPYCILSVPLLVEAQMQDLVDRIAVVDIDEKTQLSRLMTRDNITENEARKMLESQCQRAERLAVADDIIDNSDTVASLIPQLRQLHELYLKLAENVV